MTVGSHTATEIFDVQLTEKAIRNLFRVYRRILSQDEIDEGWMQVLKSEEREE